MIYSVVSLKGWYNQVLYTSMVCCLLGCWGPASSPSFAEGEQSGTGNQHNRGYPVPNLLPPSELME